MKNYLFHYARLTFLFLVIGFTGILSLDSQAQIIRSTSSEILWVDANKCGAEGPQGAWVSYEIVNNTGVALTNVKVIFSKFSGTNAALFVRPQDTLRTFYYIAAGDSVPVFYYIDYSAVCGQPTLSGLTANFTVSVNATGRTPVSSSRSLVTNTLITASAAGIVESSVISQGFYVGQQLIQTVVYSFGNNTNLFFQPAGEANFPDGCIRLVQCKCTGQTGNVTGIIGEKDKLHFPNANVPGGGGTITIEFVWESQCINPPFTFHPWAAAKSGQKYKYNGFSGTQTIPSPEFSLEIQKSVNPTFFPNSLFDGGYGSGIA